MKSGMAAGLLIAVYLGITAFNVAANAQARLPLAATVLRVSL